MRLQAGWPVWHWFTVMGLEHKCPSLHYHSQKRLIPLCLLFYHRSLPSSFMWFWACDGVDIVGYQRHWGGSELTADRRLNQLFWTVNIQRVIFHLQFSETRTLKRKCLDAVQSLDVYIHQEKVPRHCTDKSAARERIYWNVFVLSRWSCNW